MLSATCLDGFLGELSFFFSFFLGELSTSIAHPPAPWHAGLRGLLIHLPLLCLPGPQTGTPSKVSSKPGSSSFWLFDIVQVSGLCLGLM